jgi:hypothetical protein
MTDTTRDAAQLPQRPARSHRAAPVELAAPPGTRERRLFPGWRWVAVAFAFPVAGYIAWKVGGRVNAVGAALVGYDTDLGSLAIMGFVSGAALGAAQGLVLAREGRHGLALPWGLAMPVLFALGWCASTGIGVDVADQFTVFGAAGAVLFTLLSGFLLARFTPTRAQAA